MGRSVWWIGAVAVGLSLEIARAQSPAAAPSNSLLGFRVPDVIDLNAVDSASPAPQSQSAPLYLVTQDTESVYAPPKPPREDEGINNGGVNVEFDFRYLTDYVYRGISHNKAAGGDPHASNFQAETQLSFNLGKLPNPYVGLFEN
jgi:hypothetical protein